MKGKIHADELAFSGGSRVAIAHGALSADHLEALPEEGIEQFRGAVTMPTGLPGTSFFLNMRFAPARGFIDAGLPIALASDYNPGSTPSGDMKFVGPWPARRCVSRPKRHSTPSPSTPLPPWACPRSMAVWSVASTPPSSSCATFPRWHGFRTNTPRRCATLRFKTKRFNVRKEATHRCT